MSKTAQHFSKIAATLFLAFAMITVARVPMQYQMADAAEPTAMQASMPCENMAKHAAADVQGGTHDHGTSGNDSCCGGALCAGYAYDGVAAGLAAALRVLSFAQSPPDVLHVADIARPKRPPRFL